MSALVVGLGESLVRLSPPGYQRLEQAGELEVHVGGAEMNALIGLSALGLTPRWLTRLADNPLGHRIAAHASAHGVEPVVDWDRAARAPLYFVEHGAVPRPSEVLYDRAGTAMAAVDPDTFDWQHELAGAAAALCSGITCALGPGAPGAVRAMFTEARAVGAGTIFDVNHRSRLWSWQQAVPVLRGTVGLVDVLLANEHDLARLLERDGVAATDLARRAIGEFGHDLVVLRETEQVDHREVAVRVTAVTEHSVRTSDSYRAEVVDAFGAGDAAMAALVAGLLSGDGVPDAIDGAAWACAFQHTIPGDSWQVRPADLDRRTDQVRRILR